MIVYATQLVFFIFWATCVYCETSHKYRDCDLHVWIRGALMVSAAVLMFKMSILVAYPIYVQLMVFAGTCIAARYLYVKVLKRQLKIKNFRLMKMYLNSDFVRKLKEY